MGSTRSAGVVGAALILVACGGNTTARCGAGTHVENGVCLPDTRRDATPVVCGPGTELDGDRCVLSRTAPDASAPAPDTTPPSFAGAERVEVSSDNSVLVSWQPATDDVTPSARIVYEVAWGDTADFSPDWSSAVRTLPGATHALVSDLPRPGVIHFFRARAIDESGNADDNTVTLSATVPDVRPPQFSGCRAVTDVQHESLQVEWDEAVDDGTEAATLLYTIWVLPADATGNPRDAPPERVVTGKTSALVDGLSSGVRYTVLCGAMDAAGNRDDNTNQISIVTLADGTRPVFGGVLTATKVKSDTVNLTWNEATDDVTEPAGILYAVYAGTAAGAEDFSTPVLLTAHGQTGRDVPGLATRTTHFFVVRARDRAGNEDQNTVEISVALTPSFELDVQPIFTSKCAILGCHTAQDPVTPPKQGMNLDAGSAYAQIVNVHAVEGATLTEPNLMRVSTDGVLVNSYMYRKITGTQPFTGSTSPPAISPNGPLSQEQKQVLIDWMAAGAAND